MSNAFKRVAPYEGERKPREEIRPLHRGLSSSAIERLNAGSFVRVLLGVSQTSVSCKRSAKRLYRFAIERCTAITDRAQRLSKNCVDNRGWRAFAYHFALP